MPNPFKLFTWFLLCLLTALGSTAHAADEANAPAKKRKILFFTRSQGFEHTTIKILPGKTKSFAQEVLEKLGEQNNFEVTTTKDGTIFTEEKLAPFDAFIFCTTGDLCKEGGDKQSPMTKEGKELFINLIKKGKGFIAMHNGADTFHSPGGEGHGGTRNKQDDPANYDSYVTMLGAEFMLHGKQQKLKITCHDQNFPGIADWKNGAEMMEEWYTLKNFAPDIHVIFTLETGGTEGWMYQRQPYPVTWARKYGEGRVYYTAMGHREDVWNNTAYQKLLVGAIDFVTRKVDTDLTPNLEKVAPKAMELPVEPPGGGKKK